MNEINKNEHCYALWNAECGETLIFPNINAYKEYAIKNKESRQVWDDNLFIVEMGKNIFGCQEVDLYTFKSSLCN